MEYTYNPITGQVTNSKGKVLVTRHHGYLMMKVGNKKLPQHHFAFDFMGVPRPSGMDVDHINGIRDDNRWCNLRLVTRSENRRNSARPRHNKTGIIGVCWHKHGEKWEVKGLRKTIGYSRDFFEACCMRKSWENKVGGFSDRHGTERMYAHSNDGF